MQYKVAVCDDEENELSHIASLIKKYNAEHKIELKTDVFSSSRELLSTYNTAGQYDIVFLDVEMPGMSGLELAHRIRHIPDTWVKLIFVSNYPKYMQESFNVQAFNYLEKPLTYKGFSRLMTRVIDQIESGRDDVFIVSGGNNAVKVPIRDILYIEAISDSNGLLNIITTKDTIRYRGSIIATERKLGIHSFVSPHRGILVNLLHVHFVTRKELILDNGKALPISRRQEKCIKSIFAKGIATLYH